mmetsp:Transcript_56908/g.113079  ORF Transcript_56908/g.113079 Transcript_56908/m.113079 type:complete len:81 (+) Transcript_56908:243-485(+)
MCCRGNMDSPRGGWPGEKRSPKEKTPTSSSSNEVGADQMAHPVLEVGLYGFGFHHCPRRPARWPPVVVEGRGIRQAHACP